MDVESLAKQLILKGMTEEQQSAVLDSIKSTMLQARAVQKQRVGENVQVVVQSLKKIEADLRGEYSDVADKLAKRIAAIKDGKDGQNGVNGKDGRDGRPGRDGSTGPKGANGLDGRNGIDGKDGVSVTNAYIDFDGSLVINLSDGQVLNVGEVVSQDLAEKIQVISTMSTNGAVGISDEGASISTGVKNINFVGAAVTASASGDDVTVNVSSGTGTVTSVAATAGTGIGVTGSPITTSGTLTITNTAPDQVVSLTGAGTTSISGTYPNFTITSADSTVGTVTSVSGTGTVSGIALSGTVTSSGNLTLGGTLDLSSPPTIGNTAPNAATFTTVNAATFDTNVAAAGLTLSGTSLAADGTDTNINMLITPKGFGGVGINGSPTGDIAGSTLTAKFCVKQDESGPVAAFVKSNNTAATPGSTIFACRSRGTLLSPTVVQNNDRLVSILALGFDGTDLASSSEIDFEVDGTPGANDMPGRIVFKTTPDGSQTPTEALRIDSAQNVKMSKADIDGGTIDGTTIGGASAAAATVTTLTATADSAFTSTGALTISKGTVAQRPGAPAAGMLRFNDDSDEFEGYNGTVWASVGGAALVNDTSTSTNVFPLFANATTGTASTLNTSDAKFLYKPSTGELQSTVLVASNGIVVNSATIAENYTIAATNNAMSAGPITINSGVTVTISSGARYVVI